MTVIAHNITAMNTQRQYGINTDLKAKTAEKLASGYRINRAADDAAGLAISEKMRSQIRGLTKGVQNTEEGVSLCHVADGALNEVSAMLHRMKELSVQSANGTNTDEDRENLQDEVSQLLEEIDRISEDTEFNTIHIFQGDTERTVISAEYEELTAGNFKVTGIPTDTVSTKYVITADDTGFNINNDAFTWADLKDNSNNDLSQSPIVAGTYSMEYHGLTISIDVEDNAKMDDVIGLLNGAEFSTKVTSQNTSTVVSVKAFNASMQCVTGDVKQDTFTLSVNNGAFTIESSGGTGDDGSLGHVLSTSLSGMDEVPAGTYAISFEYGSGGVYNTMNLEVTTSATMPRDELLNALNDAELENYSVYHMDGFAELTNGNVYADFRSDDMETAGFSYGDEVILNYVYVDNKVGLQLGTDGPILWESYSRVPSWVDGKFVPGKIEYSDGRGNRITIQDINGDMMEMGWKDKIAQGAIASFDLLSDVHNEIFTGITLKENTLVTGSIASVNDSGYRGNMITPPILIVEETDLRLWIQSGANEGQGMYLEIGKMSTSILGLADMDISTADGATKALGQVREALAQVSKNRSRIGAQQNRLEHTIDRENVAIENLTASESGIRDADMAFEMVCLSKYNILEQTGQAMMAQANQSKQGVLQLLSFS